MKPGDDRRFTARQQRPHAFRRASTCLIHQWFRGAELVGRHQQFGGVDR
jgi:hypothetical protein